MDDIFLMHKINSQQKLLHNYFCVFLIELLIFDDLLQKRTLLLILKDNMNLLFILKKL